MLIASLLLITSLQAFPQRVLVRGEVIEFDAGGAAQASVTGTGLTLTAAQGKLKLDTSRLRPGSYTLEVGNAKHPFTLAAKPHPERYPLWKWGGTAPKSFAYYRERGFTSVGSPMVSAPLEDSHRTVRDIRLSLDEAARQGLDYSIYLNPLYDPGLKADTSLLAERYEGTKMAQPYPRNAKVVAHAKATAQRATDLFGGYPAWRQSLLGSEFQLDYNFASDAAAIARSEANVDVRTAGIYRQPKENMPVNGVIADSNPRYQFLKWWYHRGMGDAALNETMSQDLRASRSELLTWHDPFRLAPVVGSAKGLGAISTWTYAHPDMTRLYSVRVLQAAARHDRQKAMQTITLFQYPRFVQSVTGNDAGSLENDKPGGNNFFTAGPDFAKQALWLVFSQRPDIIGIYFGGALQPDDPNVDQNRASPETFNAIGKVARELIEPYGPTILAGTPLKPKVAVLLSAAAIWLGESPKNAGYATEQILPYASLLAMNQIPFDVVLDEDVAGGRLSGYDVLIMPQAGALTQSMVNQLKQFSSRGGDVIADASLKADIGTVTKTNYDFTFQTKVDGVALAAGQAVLAEENRRRMETYAADLGKLITVDRYARADSPRALVNTVDAGDLKLVFVVNDNRTGGPRFGAGKLHLEKGVALETNVTLPSSGLVFDAMTGQTVKSGRHTLPAAEGRLFAVLPEATTVTVQAGTTISGTVKLKSGKAIRGAFPLRVEVIEPDGTMNKEFSRSITAKDGAFSIPFPAAVNDPKGAWTVRVTDLVTRQKVETTVTR